ncbi:glycosyltransferase [Lutibaculum baratangense]|uniref:Glycosyltransferase n=1 Tax=Lutibaculum baratangense AMV1 TaxID=631454 RepID=V4T7P9_9HYPH|nr:glycosyltransferase [Lutibaculum baratangense]ESR22638.1 hypothetical protein N177_3774 [Lutibaculum baratangense AMV1]
MKLRRLFPRTASLRRRGGVSREVEAGNRANAERRWPDAERHYAAALAKDPSLTGVWVQYGHALKEQGFVDRAVTAYRLALGFDPQQADTHLQLGHALKLLGEKVRAAESYRRASIVDPGFIESRKELQALGEPLPGPNETLSKEALEREALKGGHRDVLEGRQAGAGEEPREEMQLAAADIASRNGAGRELVDLFDSGFYKLQARRHGLSSGASHEESLQHFFRTGLAKMLPIRQGLEFDPLFYSETYLPGMPFKPENAYRHWVTVGLRQSHHPNRPAWVRNYVGATSPDLDALGLETWHHVCAGGQSFPNWVSLFKAYADGGVLDARCVLSSSPDATGLLIGIAERLLKDGRTDEALRVFQRIMLTRPGNARVRRRVANMLLERGFYAEAAEHYRILATDEAGRAEALLNLSFCYERTGDLPRTLDILRDATAAAPGDRGIREHFHAVCKQHIDRTWALAQATARMGDSQAAQRLLVDAASFVAGLTEPDEQLPARPVKSVAIVGNKDLPQCYLYRIEQKMEHLEAAGYRVKLYDVHTEVPDYLAEAAGFEAVIFYRVLAFQHIIEAVQKSRELGIVTFYEIDDLVFDAELYPPSYESYGGLITRDEYIGLEMGVPLCAEAMSLCDYGIASTPPLACHMERFVRSGLVFVHRNAFGAKHEAFRRKPPVATASDAVTIFYGSGTKAHKEDFQEFVEPALVEAVRRHGDRVNIVLVGHITRTDRLKSIEKHVTYVDATWDVDAYWSMLAVADINLAVLRPSEMADAKSEIKWLEAAMLGVPSLVSDTATYREVVKDGETGFLARTVADWTKTLDRLIADRDLRRRVGAAARRQVEEEYGIDAMAGNIRRILEEAVPVEEARKRPLVAIVNVFYPPQAIGGATRVVHDNVRDLQRLYGDRCDFVVFTTIEGDRRAYHTITYAQDGVRVLGVVAPDNPRIDQVVQDPKMEEAVERFLDIAQPDLAHFHCIQRLTVGAVEAALNRDIPYVVTVHDGWWISDRQFLVDAAGHLDLYDYGQPYRTAKSSGKDAFERLMRLRRPLMEARKVLAVSEPFAEIYRQCGVPNVQAVPNGVSDLPQVHRVPSPDGKVRLGFIGSMSNHKGWHLVEHALRNGRFENLRLLVVDHGMAAGEERDEMWGATEVAFRPKWPQARIGDLYGTLDVLLAPSVWPESYGLVTREALLCGCWAVASDRGSIGEDIQHGVNGYRISVEDSEPLTEVLEAMNKDPQRYLQSPPPHTKLRMSEDQARDLFEIYAELLGWSDVIPDALPGESDEQGLQIAAGTA